MNKLFIIIKNKYFLITASTFVVLILGVLLYLSFFMIKKESDRTALSFAWARNNRLYYIDNDSKRLNVFQTLPFFNDRQLKTVKEAGQKLFGSKNENILLLETFDFSDRKYLSLFNTEKKEFTAFNVESPNLIYEFSPNGKLIAYVTKPNQQGKATVNIYNTETGELQTRGALPYLLANISSMGWSNDAKYLFLETQPSDFATSSEYYSLNMETRNIEILFVDSDSYSSFRNYDKKILFISQEGLYVYSFETRAKDLVWEREMDSYSANCEFASEEKILCQVLENEGKTRNLYEINLKKEKVEVLKSYTVENPYLAFLEFEVALNGKKAAVLNKDQKIEIVKIK